MLIQRLDKTTGKLTGEVFPSRFKPTPAPPGTPTDLRAAPITQTAITLNWTKPAGAIGFQVNGGALTAWTNAGDVSLYQFTGLTANTSYTLQVRAQNSDGDSAAVSTTVKTLPNAPTSPTTSKITVSGVKLSWTASVGGADSYEVSSDGGTSWADSGSDTEHSFTGLTANTVYTLQVRAKNISGVSAAVSAASVTTLITTPNAPGAPTGLSTSGITQTAITLNWTKPAGAIGFQVNGGALT
ncbi:MAG: fibronectin type III domain-containing protein, partial [Chloroflexota bacterium]|nr:fibronectin type III domain-containing protein [Chloroflexota bacterium]